MYDLPPQVIVATFVKRWASGRYYSAFSLLTEESPLRNGLSANEWVERRKAWGTQAAPDQILIDYIRELTPRNALFL